MKELKYFSNLLTLGKITRRDFMGRAAALGVTTALATTLAGKAARAATPKMGGRFRLALTGGASSDDLDPATTLDTYMINVNFGQLRTCLTEISEYGELIGELAESWDASDDATSWTFKLRQGV